MGCEIKHLCDFSNFQKCDNHIITLQMSEKFPRIELVLVRQKISPDAKNQPWGLRVSSINSVHINIYIDTYIYTKRTKVFEHTKFQHKFLTSSNY